MNSSLDQKKISVIEDALKLKDEGKRLSFIIAKFPQYESEIREIFGTVVFIKENKDKVAAPKNILKTLLSKIPDISPPRKEIISKKEAASAANIQPLFIEDDEDNIYGDSLMINEGNTIFNKWKIIIPVIILAIVMGIILFRSDSKIESEIINKNAETAQNSIELNPSLNATNISSSTKESGD